MKSMTGYGRAQELLEGRDITVEVRAVNHRFFEFSCRTPKIYGYLEEKLKSLTQAYASRGKVEVGVTLYNLQSGDGIVEIDENLAGRYAAALRDLGTKLCLDDDLSLSSISRFNDIFIVRREVPDEELIWNLVRQVAEKALQSFVHMRSGEGERMKTDILGRLAQIEDQVGFIEEQSPKTVAAYRERIYAKLQEVLENRTIDEGRVLTEAAIFSEKVAVAEETVRLRSHITQFRELLEQEEPVGRKLDFLVQELNREINTVGSKAQDMEIARRVVDVKAEIEKIREQIQNIE